MAILRLVGPVISTRRSRRSRGAAATCQSPLRISTVDSRKSGRSPAGDPLPARTAGREQLVAPYAEVPLQVGDEGQCLGRQHLLGPVDGRAGHLDARHPGSVSSQPSAGQALVTSPEGRERAGDDLLPPRRRRTRRRRARRAPTARGWPAGWAATRPACSGRYDGSSGRRRGPRRRSGGRTPTRAGPRAGGRGRPVAARSRSPPTTSPPRSRRSSSRRYCAAMATGRRRSTAGRPTSWRRSTRDGTRRPRRRSTRGSSRCPWPRWSCRRRRPP